MINFFTQSKLVFIFLVIVSFSTTVLYILFETKCFSQSCGELLREGLIIPLFWMNLSLIPVISFFLFFPEAIFKSWLKKIAWWYGLGLFFVVISTPIYSSNILHIGRSEIIINGMILLAVITVVFVFVTRAKNRV